MAYVPTTFVDRSVEFANRRKFTAVPGQADTFDVARAEGTVFAEGTKPDAANLNAEFGKIKDETDSINTSLNLPDYANLYDVTLTKEHEYTATQNGYLMVSVKGTEGQVLAIYYNSKLILHGSIGGTNYSMGHCVPMTKGDTIKVNGNWGQGSYSIFVCVFVPSK